MQNLLAEASRVTTTYFPNVDKGGPEYAALVDIFMLGALEGVKTNRLNPLRALTDIDVWFASFKARAQMDFVAPGVVRQ
jgi:hypothetical protein